MKKPPKRQRKLQRSRKRPAMTHAGGVPSSPKAKQFSHARASEPFFPVVSRFASPAFAHAAHVARDVRLPAPVAAVLASRTPAEREAMALLAAPLFMLAFAIAYAQTLHTPLHLDDLFAETTPVVAARPYVPVFQRAITREIASSPVGVARVAEVAVRDLPLSMVRSASDVRDNVRVLQPVITAWTDTLRVLPSSNSVRTAAFDTAPELAGSVGLPSVGAMLQHTQVASFELPRYLVQESGELDVIAMSAGVVSSLPLVEDFSRQLARVASAAPIIAKSSDGGAAWTRSCSVSPETKHQSAFLTPAKFDARSAQNFGLALARAAREQIGDIVIYNDKYRSISFPMGDVNPLFGVCTDVVIRAYRALGVDLQALVHQTKSGHGDTSIDHRRTDVLRRFFSLYGETLPVTDFSEDYLPGDIVTYYRPQNNHSRSHIAVVSDEIGPSGRPMIIHNRGWGVQMEDALLVDRITGHYRFAGQPVTPAVTGNGPLIQKASVRMPARQ